MINSAKYCSINQFIECKYENNLAVLGDGTSAELQAAWKKIRLEYLTLIGYDMVMVNLEINITNITSRINCMNALIFVQRHAMEHMGVPLEQYFYTFKPFGYAINYPCTNDEMLTQLQTIETKERQYNMLLTRDKKRLENIQIAKGDESEAEDSRPHFIKVLNALSESIGFHINRDAMMLEELGVLIAEKNAAAKAAKKN